MEIRPLWCRLCGKEFMTYRQMNGHMNKHKLEERRTEEKSHGPEHREDRDPDVRGRAGSQRKGSRES